MTHQCSNCLLKIADSKQERCPNCGFETLEEPNSKSHTVPRSDNVLISNFMDLLIRPDRFFSSNASNISTPGGLPIALTFALCVSWFSSFVNFIWSSAFNSIFKNSIEEFLKMSTVVFNVDTSLTGGHSSLQSQIFNLMFGASSVILAPFLALFKLLFVAAIVHLGIKIFCRETFDRPHRYETTLKILSYSYVAFAFSIIPGIGLVIAWLLSFYSAVIGIREVYKTTTGRSALAVLFPDLIVLSLLMLFTLILLIISINLFRLVS